MHLKFQLNVGREFLQKLCQGDRHLLLIIHRSADCSEQVRILRGNGVLFIQLQGTDERFLQLREEMKRTS